MRDMDRHSTFSTLFLPIKKKEQKMKPKISMITLGVKDLKISIKSTPKALTSPKWNHPLN